MIAALTPLEYESVGARIRVHRVRELPDGSIEVMLHGGYSDAKYVQGALKNQKGVKTTEPTQSQGAEGILMTFIAKGSTTNSLSREKAIGVLSSDQYIQVMQNV
jgi:hypothetical protein